MVKVGFCVNLMLSHYIETGLRWFLGVVDQMFRILDLLLRAFGINSHSGHGQVLWTGKPFQYTV